MNTSKQTFQGLTGERQNNGSLTVMLSGTGCKCFGESFLSALEKTNKCLNLTEEDFDYHYDSIVKNWDRILNVLDFLPGWEEYKKIYKKFGHPIHAEKIGIPSDLLRYTLPCSTFYRDRYDFVFVMNTLASQTISQKRRSRITGGKNRLLPFFPPVKKR